MCLSGAAGRWKRSSAQEQGRAAAFRSRRCARGGADRVRRAARRRRVARGLCVAGPAVRGARARRDRADLAFMLALLSNPARWRQPRRPPDTARAAAPRSARKFRSGAARARPPPAPQAVQQRALPRGAPVLAGASATGGSDRTLHAGWRCGLAAMPLPHQVWRRQQPHRAHQLVRDVGIVEVGEQQHQGAVLEQRAHAHRRGGRIGLGRLH